METTNEEERQRFELIMDYKLSLDYLRYEDEYMKGRGKTAPQDKTPKFEFYLYNDAGRIIKQYLSIHEIQQILLQQSHDLGLRQMAWLIGRNETNWRPTDIPKKKTMTTTSTTPTTPLAMAINSIGNNSQV